MIIKYGRETVRWVISSVLIPIAVAFIASGLLSRERHTEILYREVPLIEKFDALDYFALKEGNFWVYSGKGRCQEGSGEATIIDYVYKRRVRVKSVIKTERFSLATMEQEYLELSKAISCESGNGVFTFLILSNKVYSVPEQFLDQDSLSPERVSQFLSLAQLEYEFPLFDGQQFGTDITQFLRRDFRYRTVVHKADEYFSDQGNKVSPVTVYRLVNSTLGTDADELFIPFKGIISATSRHHGTVDEFEEKLTQANVQ